MKIALIIFIAAFLYFGWGLSKNILERDRLTALNDSIIESNWIEIKRNAAANDSLAAINDSLWLELEEEISYLIRRYNACAVSSINSETGNVPLLDSVILKESATSSTPDKEKAAAQE